MAGAYGAVRQGLRDVTLAGAGRTADQHRGVLGDEAAGGQLGDEARVQAGALRQIEVLQGLVEAEAGFVQAPAIVILRASRASSRPGSLRVLSSGVSSGFGFMAAGFLDQCNRSRRLRPKRAPPV